MAGIDKDAHCERTYVENNVNSSIDFIATRFLNFDIFSAIVGISGPAANGSFSVSSTISSHIIAARLLACRFCSRSVHPASRFLSLARKQMSGRRQRRSAAPAIWTCCARLAGSSENIGRSSCCPRNIPGSMIRNTAACGEKSRRALERIGCAPGSKVVCCSRFGVPQFRKRLILMAVRRIRVRPERFADIFEHEFLVPEADPNCVISSVAEAIGHLPPLGAGETHPRVSNHRTRALSEINFKRLAWARPGESNAYMKDTEHGDLTLRCHRRLNRRLKERCFADVYTRMRPDRPSPTITTKCHSISNGHFGHYDMNQVRAISLREAAILQSFPEDYVFYSDDEGEPVARMIGNAVPPRLAGFFAGYLVNSLASGCARPKQ